MIDLVDLIVGAVLFLMGFGAVVYLVLRRWQKSRVLIIEKDFRNPNRKERKFYAIYNDKEKYISLYSNLFQPFVSNIIPPFQLESYVHNGRVFAYQGVTGQPEDDNIVPVHYPLVSGASALETSKEISAATINNIHKIMYAKRYAIDDDVEYVPIEQPERNVFDAITNKMTKVKDKFDPIPGRVTNMTFNGLAVTFDIPQDSKLYVGKATPVFSDDKKNPMMLGLILPYEAGLDKILLRPNKKDYQEYSLTDYVNIFFSTEWVMQNLGVIPVDDVNVVLKNNKEAVSSFNSKVADWKNNKQSWLAKNQVLIGFMMLGVGLGMMLLLGYSGLSQYMSALGNSAVASNHAVTNVSISAIQEISRLAGVSSPIVTNSSPV